MLLAVVPVVSFTKAQVQAVHDAQIEKEGRTASCKLQLLAGPAGAWIDSKLSSHQCPGAPWCFTQSSATHCWFPAIDIKKILKV